MGRISLCWFIISIIEGDGIIEHFAVPGCDLNTRKIIHYTILHVVFDVFDKLFEIFIVGCYFSCRVTESVILHIHRKIQFSAVNFFQKIINIVIVPGK